MRVTFPPVGAHPARDRLSPRLSYPSFLRKQEALYNSRRAGHPVTLASDLVFSSVCSPAAGFRTAAAARVTFLCALKEK